MTGFASAVRSLCSNVVALTLLLIGGCAYMEWPPPSSSQAAVRRPAPVESARLIPKPQPPRISQAEPLPPPAAAPSPPPAGSRDSVVTRPGDTPFTVAKREDVSVRSIIEANRLDPPYELKPGQELIVPREREHIVRPDESLYTISRTYGVDLYALASANGLIAPYSVSEGQRLRIPKAEGGAAEPVGVPPVATAALPKAPPAVAEPPPAEGVGFIWPVKGTVISSFGPKSKGLHNDGINIAAERGSAVRAAESGTVAYAGNELRGFGNLLLIKHVDGWVTAYAHNEALLVKRGDKVKRGQVIARVGNSGSVNRPQLHFELRKGKRAFDPLRYLPVPSSA